MLSYLEEFFWPKTPENNQSRDLQEFFWPKTPENKQSSDLQEYFNISILHTICQIVPERIK